MALPLGFAHPWTAVDRELLGVDAAAWAIEPDAALVAAVWGLGVLVFAIAATAIARGQRGRFVISCLVVLAALHVIVGLVLSVVVPAWPSKTTLAVFVVFVYPNHSAAAWGSCIPAAIYLARQHHKPFIWWAAAVVLILGVATVSASRGGILVAALVAAPCLWFALPAVSACCG